MEVTVCQLDNRMERLEEMLGRLAEHIAAEGSEFLLLPEMCFAAWLAVDPVPDAERWQAAVESHARWLDRLAALGAKAVMGTRPIVRAQRRDSPQQRQRAAVDVIGPALLLDVVLTPHCLLIALQLA